MTYKSPGFMVVLALSFQLFFLLCSQSPCSPFFKSMSKTNVKTKGPEVVTEPSLSSFPPPGLSPVKAFSPTGGEEEANNQRLADGFILDKPVFK